MSLDTYLILKLIGIVLFGALGIRALKRDRRYSLRRSFWIAFWAVVTGYFGSKFWYIIQHIYGREPYDISDWTVLMDAAGSVLYGWILGGVVGVCVFCWAKKIPKLETLDTLVPGLLVAQILNRFGCLAGGCCWGKSSDLPWAVMNEYAARPMHPVQIYEAIADFILLVFVMRQSRSDPGRRTFIYLIGYASVRFFIEFLRGDNLPAWLGMTVPQITSLFVILMSTLIMKKSRLKNIN